MEELRIGHSEEVRRMSYVGGGSSYVKYFMSKHLEGRVRRHNARLWCG